MKQNRNPCNESHWSIGSNPGDQMFTQQPKCQNSSIETLEYEWHLCLVASQVSQSSGERDIPQGTKLKYSQLPLGTTRIPPRRSLIRNMSQTRTAALMVMKSLTIVFVVMLFCAVSSSQIITPCPKECVCEEQYFAESKGVGAKVNCSGKKLKRFPWPLPQVTTTL